MKEDVTLEDEVEVILPDHKLLLSFVNDSGKQRFLEWWCDEGEESFENYCINFKGWLNNGKGE